MLEAQLINECADPALTPAIVEQFVQSVGSDDALAITVNRTGKRVLVRRPKTAIEALQTVREHMDHADVRVGITQIPVGPFGEYEHTALTERIFDPCENLRLGTALFAKIARIVTKWYGYPTDETLLPQLLDDALHAWKTGRFETVSVFGAEDVDGRTFFGPTTKEDKRKSVVVNNDVSVETYSQSGKSEIDHAEMRINLSKIADR